MTRPKRQKGLTRVEHEVAWDRVEAAARKFKGIGIELEAKTMLRHITPTVTGYQVRFYRNGRMCFSRSVRGHSPESLHEAMRIRDEAARDQRQVRTNLVPEWVLREAGLEHPVIGISRLPSRSCYRVFYVAPSGRNTARAFYYRVVSEDDAYKAAIAFLQTLPQIKRR